MIQADTRADTRDLVVVDCDDLAEGLRGVADLVDVFSDRQLVLLASKFDMDFIVSAFNCGVHGFILKEISCNSLVGSLKLVALGEKIMPSRLADHLPNWISNDVVAQHHKSETLDLLSEREKETLRCLVSGYPNKIIARRMDISEATVKVHVKAILRKLEVQNRTQAAIWAVNNRLVSSNESHFDSDCESAVPLELQKEPHVLHAQS
ncbi:LuxR C-terminal-related transcriptional regulator [Allopontixanthobacter sediminis]|uniref:DNA-binding response regulator n=1 Tax=Allopontixanthobacter sediminis TaxID=1689985 RepID=A0A845AZ89_9SPHN|nr:response regulator transcription factor [Allopontixanthobacter sediminis]MXP44341.1 DNA-binding response regulator [Allopontixanthobacter sediminis]